VYKLWLFVLILSANGLYFTMLVLSTSYIFNNIFVYKHLHREIVICFNAKTILRGFLEVDSYKTGTVLSRERFSSYISCGYCQFLLSVILVFSSRIAQKLTLNPNIKPGCLVTWYIATSGKAC